MPKDSSPTPRISSLVYLILLLWLVIVIKDFFAFRANVDVIPYSQFLSYVQTKNLSEVTIGNDRIEGTLKEAAKGKNRQFITVKVDDPRLADKLYSAGIKFSAIKESGFASTFFSWFIPGLIIFAVWMLVFRRFNSMQRGGGILPIGKSRARIYVEKDVRTRFEDVAGVDEAKEELKEIVNFLKNPKTYSKLGGHMPKGVLLVGPPGTGKTLLARAVAGEASVPFFSINGSEFVELFVGLGAARVRDLFQQARGAAPCIIFIDELDALGKARGLASITGSGNDEKEQTLNQLLAELDGFDPSSGIILLAATNRPEVLDPALLRAGRFDRHVVIDKPDRIGRVKILNIYLRTVKLKGDVNTESLAAMTAGFSGADLANLVNEAALIATRRGADCVEIRDFTEAIERIVAGLERKTRVLNPEEKKRVAYHEMGHAICALALGLGEVVHKVSIIPRGIGALGYTMRRPTEDRYLMSRRELIGRMTIAMGGRAAELAFFDDISTGAADDLDKATDIARAMTTRYGMGHDLGLAIYEREPTPILGSQAPVRSFEYSEPTAVAIDREINKFLDDSMKQALSLIETYRHVIEEGVKILLSKETIDENEVKELWKKSTKPEIEHRAIYA